VQIKIGDFIINSLNIILYFNASYQVSRHNNKRVTFTCYFQRVVKGTNESNGKTIVRLVHIMLVGAVGDYRLSLLIIILMMSM